MIMIIMMIMKMITTIIMIMIIIIYYSQATPYEEARQPDIPSAPTSLPAIRAWAAAARASNPASAPPPAPRPPPRADAAAAAAWAAAWAAEREEVEGFEAVRLGRVLGRDCPLPAWLGPVLTGYQAVRESARVHEGAGGGRGAGGRAVSVFGAYLVRVGEAAGGGACV